MHLFNVSEPEKIYNLLSTEGTVNIEQTNSNSDTIVTNLNKNFELNPDKSYQDVMERTKALYSALTQDNVEKVKVTIPRSSEFLMTAQNTYFVNATGEKITSINLNFTRNTETGLYQATSPEFSIATDVEGLPSYYVATHAETEGVLYFMRMRVLGSPTTLKYSFFTPDNFLPRAFVMFPSNFPFNFLYLQLDINATFN